MGRPGKCAVSSRTLMRPKWWVVLVLIVWRGMANRGLPFDEPDGRKARSTVAVSRALGGVKTGGSEALSGRWFADSGPDEAGRCCHARVAGSGRSRACHSDHPHGRARISEPRASDCCGAEAKDGGRAVRCVLHVRAQGSRDPQGCGLRVRAATPSVPFAGTGVTMVRRGGLTNGHSRPPTHIATTRRRASHGGLIQPAGRRFTRRDSWVASASGWSAVARLGKAAALVCLRQRLVTSALICRKTEGSMASWPRRHAAGADDAAPRRDGCRGHPLRAACLASRTKQHAATGQRRIGPQPYDETECRATWSRGRQTTGVPEPWPARIDGEAPSGS